MKKIMKNFLLYFIPALCVVICNTLIYQQTLSFKDYVKNHNPDVFYGNEGIVILCSFLSAFWIVNTVFKPYISVLQKQSVKDFECCLKPKKEGEGK